MGGNDAVFLLYSIAFAYPPHQAATWLEGIWRSRIGGGEAWYGYYGQHRGLDSSFRWRGAL